MDYLPASIQSILHGKIDPKSQYLLERYIQLYLIALTITAILASYLYSSVILSLEILLAGYILLCLSAVPPWPYLNRYPITFLPVRKSLSIETK